MVSRTRTFFDDSADFARERAEQNGRFDLRTPDRQEIIYRSYRFALYENRRHAVIFQRDRRAHRFERFFYVSHRMLAEPSVAREFESHSAARGDSAQKSHHGFTAFAVDSAAARKHFRRFYFHHAVFYLHFRA